MDVDIATESTARKIQHSSTGIGFYVGTCQYYTKCSPHATWLKHLTAN